MPRSPRADEAGGIYHALNRGNLRATIFHKDEDFEAFEKIIGEGLERYRVELYHAHYHTGGMGHVYQQRYKSFSIQSDSHLLVACRYVERNALRAGLVRSSEDWHKSSGSNTGETPYRKQSASVRGR